MGWKGLEARDSMDHQLISDAEAMARLHKILVQYVQRKLPLGKAIAEIAEAVEASGRPLMRESALDWVDARTEEQRTWADSGARSS